MVPVGARAGYPVVRPPTLEANSHRQARSGATSRPATRRLVPERPERAGPRRWLQPTAQVRPDLTGVGLRARACRATRLAGWAARSGEGRRGKGGDELRKWTDTTAGRQLLR
jgi:hypothetical protein